MLRKSREDKMTHDELLELIAANEEFYGDGTNRTPSWSALRAVVELHTGNSVSNRCVACLHGSKCETIQAIEKELK